MKESLRILGMAKSSFKFKTSGPRRNLELDVLRLIYFINLYKDEKIKVLGIMLVHNEEIKKLILEKWLPKYGFSNLEYFKIFTFENECEFKDNHKKICEEKMENAKFINSKVNESQEVTEKILVRKIEEEFGIQNLFEVNENEFKSIEWDYYKLLKRKF